MDSSDPGKVPDDSGSSQDPESNNNPGDTSSTCANVSWETIKSPEEAVCFKSIDKAMAAMPERIRANWVMIHTTRSAQAASLQKPRIIMVSPDGSFLASAATDQEKSKDFEVAVYNYEKNQWDFAGIDFTQNPPKVERELCKSCHGTEPHPIWTEYPNWPAAFAGQPQTLKDQEAAILNEIASGKSTLPFVKNLKMRSSYRAGAILYPASKYSGIENNQTLNVVIAIKAARSLVAKLMNDSQVSEATLLKIAGEQMCSGRGNTLSSLGYNVNKELNHGIVGKDKEKVIWAGNALGSYFLGLEILNQTYKKNPDLKTTLAAVTPYVEAKQFQLYRTESLTEFFAAEDNLKGSWQAVDNNWFRNTFRKAFSSGSAACKALGQ